MTMTVNQSVLDAIRQALAGSDAVTGRDLMRLTERGQRIVQTYQLAGAASVAGDPDYLPAGRVRAADMSVMDHQGSIALQEMLAALRELARRGEPVEYRLPEQSYWIPVRGGGGFGIAGEQYLVRLRGRGRPGVGPPIHIRLEPHVLAQLDEWANARGLSRAAAVRRILEAQLDQLT